MQVGNVLVMEFNEAKSYLLYIIIFILSSRLKRTHGIYVPEPIMVLMDHTQCHLFYNNLCKPRQHILLYLHYCKYKLHFAHALSRSHHTARQYWANVR